MEFGIGRAWPRAPLGKSCAAWRFSPSMWSQPSACRSAGWLRN